MKTTLDLEDALLAEAKATALRRRTTLKTLVEQALRRELHPVENVVEQNPVLFEIGELGLPVVKRRGALLTSEMVYRAIADADEEDASLLPGGPDAYFLVPRE